MKRAAMLFCADADAPRYKVLKQRDQLPFPVDEQDGKWQDFTLDDAFRLRLMLDLVGGDGIAKTEEDQLKGLPPAYAAKVVSNGLFDCDVHPLDMSEDADIWLAVAIFEEASADQTKIRFSGWFAGALVDFPDWVSAEVAKSANLVPVRTCLVNAGRAARFVRERAVKMNLPEANDISGARQ